MNTTTERFTALKTALCDSLMRMERAIDEKGTVVHSSQREMETEIRQMQAAREQLREERCRLENKQRQAQEQLIEVKEIKEELEAQMKFISGGGRLWACCMPPALKRSYEVERRVAGLRDDSVPGRTPFEDAVFSDRAVNEARRSEDSRLTGGPRHAADEGVAWEIKLEDGWTEYDASTMRLISEAEMDGRKIVEYMARGHRYKIDLDSMEQINVGTGARRAIRMRFLETDTTDELGRFAGAANPTLLPAIPEPDPIAISFRDPRPRDHRRSEVTDVGIVAFYYPGREEAWDVLCGGGFLGNFYDLGDGGLELEAPCDRGRRRRFRNSEAAFQALKFWHRAHEFSECSGEEAFQLKQRLQGRKDFTYGGFGSNWSAMMAVLRAKFEPHTPWAAALLLTADAFLLEHNSTAGRDRVWSDNCDGEGTNWLGLQLMLIRDRLAGECTWTNFLRDLLDLETGEPRSSAAASRWQEIVRQATRACVSTLQRQGRRSDFRSAF